MGWQRGLPAFFVTTISSLWRLPSPYRFFDQGARSLFYLSARDRNFGFSLHLFAEQTFMGGVISQRMLRMFRSAVCILWCCPFEFWHMLVELRGFYTQMIDETFNYM